MVQSHSILGPRCLGCEAVVCYSRQADAELPQLSRHSNESVSFIISNGSDIKSRLCPIPSRLMLRAIAAPVGNQRPAVPCMVQRRSLTTCSPPEPHGMRAKRANFIHLPFSTSSRCGHLGCHSRIASGKASSRWASALDYLSSLMYCHLGKVGE